MVGMVSYIKLYEAQEFDLCQLTPNFVNVDDINVGSADIGQEELNILPTDIKVSSNQFYSYNFVIYQHYYILPSHVRKALTTYICTINLIIFFRCF